VRKAQTRDYRHLSIYVMPILGQTPLAALRPGDIRGLQAELLARQHARTGEPLSVKTVNNIISGSLRAMIRDAVEDVVVTHDVFPRLKWPERELPEPDPFDVDEVRRILAWFAAHRFGFSRLPGSRDIRRLPHPPFHAYVHALFMTGLRPSEASGLQWRDLDLDRALLYVRRSYHLSAYGSPKTRTAKRTVELLQETVRMIRGIQPLHVSPETPVFTTTLGGPIEPKSFSPHWYDCLRALGLRVLGLYCTKDTYVTMALRTVGDPRWVEKQTGVALATLKAHYEKSMPDPSRTQLRRLEGAFGSAELCPPERPAGTNPQFVSEIAGAKVRGGGLEPHPFREFTRVFLAA
jgi:integrase